MRVNSNGVYTLKLIGIFFFWEKKIIGIYLGLKKKEKIIIERTVITSNYIITKNKMDVLITDRPSCCTN